MVPESVRPLLPLAAIWGVGDDYARSSLVRAAPSGELRAMVSAVDAVSDDDLYGWLSGPESHSAHPSPEYVAITYLTQAADEARQLLRQA